MIEFWKGMEWPDHVSGVSFVSKMTEDLCQGATYYADLIHEKLQAAGYYDETGQFDVTEEVSAACIHTRCLVAASILGRR